MAKEKQFSDYVNDAIEYAREKARETRQEFVTPEDLLLGLTMQDPFREAVFNMDCTVFGIAKPLIDYTSEMEKLTEEEYKEDENLPYPSMMFQHLINEAYNTSLQSSAKGLTMPILVQTLLVLEECTAAYVLMKGIKGAKGEFLRNLVSTYSEKERFGEEELIFGDDNLDKAIEHDMEILSEDPFETPVKWQDYAVCVNDNLEHHNPLIGREAELDRTMQVLCRKEKNNPLHIGEPGVGKTSIVYGLAAKINAGEVPDCLKNARIFQIDLSTLVAGTQYRGDFEKRIKKVMEGVSKEECPIVYIDEIHQLVGSGAGSDSSMDGANMLKPYLESGKIRFIGSTTYEEYNRYLMKSKGLVRRFQQIEIAEPSVEETIGIVRQLKPNYEGYHHVEYDDDALEFAVKASARYITDRFLPDKAIDLIDEAGAYRRIHPEGEGKQRVDKTLVSSILSKICKVDSLDMMDDDTSKLENLGERISAKIFGQPKAVDTVAEAILMSKAGLTEEGKPMASLLFVGPTGVGKTEVARVLAKELGLSLVRFDMSEYTEKHAVAKLIGSPAGYVGYEDGGQLTDAIRKSPNCVLLLDEIEKAHPDIYNILLQVMDYARLTDNKGRQADFRNVILIMTSNAGAQYASRAKLGFESHVTAGDAMLAQVKKTFKPEFINRLSATVVFNDMTREMASMILDKKLDQLRTQLKEKNVVLTLTDEARDFILKEGFTREYGARELDRVISTRLKPLLTRAILFGKLKEGGEAVIVNDSDTLKLQ